jgi:hypothetical protein
VILPLLMGSMPAPAPMLCIDCNTFFWLGLAAGIVFSIVALLIAHHVFKD